MPRNRIEFAALILICAAFMIPLILIGIIGSYNRYFADDFCYVVWSYDRGLVQYMSEIHTSIQARFSSNFLLYFIRYADPRYTPAFTFWALIGIAISMAAPLYSLMRVLQVRHAPLMALALSLLALVVAIQVLLDKGDALRHAYIWRSGMTVYVAPKLFFGFTLSAIYGASRLRWSGWRGGLLAIGIGLLSLIGGGFSETYAAMMVGSFAALSPLVWWVLSPEDRGSVLPLLIAAMVGNLVVLGVIASVPRSMERVLVEPPSLSRFVFNSLYEAVWVTDQHFKLSPFGMTAAFLLPTIAVKRLRGAGTPAISTDQRSRLIVGIPIVIGIGMICAMAPGVYAQGAPPPRALSLPTQLLTFGIVVWSAIALPSVWINLGESQTRPYESIAQALVAIVLVMMLVGREINDLPEMIESARSFADQWDAQAADIHARIERGDPLKGLTGIGIGGNPNSSASQCAATFFKSEHLESISP